MMYNVENTSQYGFLTLFELKNPCLNFFFLIVSVGHLKP